MLEVMIMITVKSSDAVTTPGITREGVLFTRRHTACCGSVVRSARVS